MKILTVFECFESCQRGGKLNYIQNFGSHFDEETDPLDEMNICPNCGSENLSGEKYCKSCSILTKAENSEENPSNFGKENRYQKIFLRILAIIVGILIVLILQLWIYKQILCINSPFYRWFHSIFNFKK